MRNLNNVLKLKSCSSLLVVKLSEGITVAIPVVRKLSNANVLDVNEDGSFTAHWKNNWNTNGDFRSELMKFDNDLVFDDGDKKKRNKLRKKNGLVEIK